MKWTAEQEEAIYKDGSNIIVSAGAGSGKTAVLSERVIRKLKEGVDIRNILMLTFTNEAAGEMANRIRKKIKKENLKEQLEYLDSAYITTFDAFALSLVKKYHYILNINKNIKIVDSSIMNMKKKEFLEEVFIEFYKEKDTNFLKLINDFTTRDDEIIKDGVLNINKSLDLIYAKKDYLNEYISKYYNEKYIDDIFSEYFLYLKNLTSLLEEYILNIEGYMEEDSFVKLYDSVSFLFKPNKYEDLYKHNDFKLGRFTKLDEEGEYLKTEIKNIANEIKELISYSKEELKSFYLSTKDYVKAIIKIINKLDNKLELYKKNYDSYEFTDVAKMAIKIVKENEKIRNEIKYSFNEIMIDEYQDTSDLQEEFIKCIENNNVYMVGDIKQSIYRFRNANPMIFKNKYDSYKEHINGEKIDLLKNFRSRKEVLENINELFNLLMINDIGGVEYGINHSMVYGNMAYIEEGKNTNNNYMDLLTYNYEDKVFNNDEIEAFIIAQDIIAKVNNKYQVFDFDLGKNRDITFNDFCIILDRGTAMDLYKKIFEYHHIPMEVYKDSDLMNENDIYIIKNIIGLIINIQNGIYDKKSKYYFTSIARSYIGLLSDDEIFKALEENKIFKTDIYQKCQKIGKNIELKTPHEVLNEIIIEFDFYEKIILVGNVDAAIKRINYLLDLALGVENLGFTIIDFQKYLENMIKNNEAIKYKEAKSKSTSVKIMNIHKSKGLEFPICYFAGFAKKFNLQDLKSRFTYSSTYGIITPFYKDGIGEVFTKQLIKKKYYEDEIAEKIRLFYVALTRAKEKMIMVMPNIKEKKLAKKLEYLDEIKFRSFYDFFKAFFLNIQKYEKVIRVESLNLTKKYEFNYAIKKNINAKKEEQMTFIDDLIAYELVEESKASKTIPSIIDAEEKKTLNYGTKMHNILEFTNFKAHDDQIIVQNLSKHLNFYNVEIYQELEFVFEKNNKSYHGIIDLLLEYENEIKIIDYKLKNISDAEYKNQLQVYLDYVSSLNNKKIKLYLYSIIDDKLKEIEIS